MLNTLMKLRKGLVRLLEITVIVLFAILVLDVLWGVISRASGGLVATLVERGYEPWGFLPRGQTPWTEEVAINLMIWVSLLGASVAYGAKAHLGVDYFVGKLHPQAQALAEVVVNVVVGVFSVIVLLGGGVILVRETLAANLVLPAMQVKAGYMYLAVPISGLFILLFCVENIIEIVSGKRSEPETVDPDNVKTEV